MFIHIEFQMRLGDYPSMMVLRADFEENELWNKLGLALHEGVFSESSRPNNYIDRYEGALFGLILKHLGRSNARILGGRCGA